MTLFADDSADGVFFRRRFLFRFLFRAKIEQLPHQVDDRGRFLFPRRRLQRGDRRVHDLVDNSLGQSLDRHLLLGRKFAETATQAIDLGLSHSLKVLLERDNGWNHVQRLQLRFEALNFFGD